MSTGKGVLGTELWISESYVPILHVTDIDSLTINSNSLYTLFFHGGHVTPKSSGSPVRPGSGGWAPPCPREQIPDFPPVQPLHPDEEDSGDSSDPDSVKRQKL
uniref:(California timema) hypothetical protein n=1 Tax=Timema californicum TaxID=61474 RepID=A0A7R9P3V9_TIMCA|nr:unnamed protein product [Timema californicum]